MENKLRISKYSSVQAAGGRMSDLEYTGTSRGNTQGSTTRMDGNEDVISAAASGSASSAYDMQRSEILQERARKFIAERRKEQSESSSTADNATSGLQDQSLDSGTFGAVSRYRVHQTKVTCLNTGDYSEAVELGSIRSVGDSRFKINTEIVNYKNKKLISMSCSRVTLACLLSSCGGSRGGGGAIVVAVTDQNFPANVHVSEGKDCMRIIRVEGASLGELSGELISVAPTIPAGSVIVLASAAHLASVWTQSYAADFVTASRRLLGQYRGEVEVCHGPFLFMEGFKDECLARSVLEIYAWLNGMKDERTILADTIEFARMELINSGMVKEGASAAPCRIRLPMSTRNYDAKTFESGGWANLYGANPLSEATETEVISCLHGELNLKFAMNLEENPVVDRQAGSPDSPKRYIVVGSSHAGRLCAELSQLGHQVIDVIRPGWRVMPSTVLSMKDLLEKRIKEAGGCKHNDTYVFQLWDNTLHAAWAEELATIPHTKDALGKYHVQGDAIIVPSSTQTEIFKMVLPILNVAKSFNTVLVGPLPRYLYASCCRDKDHVTNLRKDDYRSKMRADCDMARQKLKDSAWFSGFERAKAINREDHSGNSATERAWMSGCYGRRIPSTPPLTGTVRLPRTLSGLPRRSLAQRTGRRG
jgi:hypothetical protein